jgi:hypothetical protein
MPLLVDPYPILVRPLESEWLDKGWAHPLKIKSFKSDTLKTLMIGLKHKHLLLELFS